MAATAQDARVTSLTLEKILPKVVDTVNKSSWILNRKFGSPQPWNGRHVQQPITTTNSTLGTSFKGTETFSTSVDFAPINMTWYATGYAQPVTISQVERGMNQTPLGVINLYKASAEFAQNSMANSLFFMVQALVMTLMVWEQSLMMRLILRPMLVYRAQPMVTILIVVVQLVIL